MPVTAAKREFGMAQ